MWVAEQTERKSVDRGSQKNANQVERRWTLLLDDVGMEKRKGGGRGSDALLMSLSGVYGVKRVLHSLRKFFGTLFPPLAFPNPKPLSPPPPPPTFLPKPSEGVRGRILGAPSSSFPLCSSPSPDSRSHCRFGAPDFTLSSGTLYDVLGVAAATSGLEIMVAYWRLAGACHPDAVVATDRLTSSCGSTRPTRRSPTRTSAQSMIEGSSSPIGDGGRSILPNRRIPSTPAADVGDGPVLVTNKMHQSLKPPSSYRLPLSVSLAPDDTVIPPLFLAAIAQEAFRVA
ncbi:hypothetical protein ZIOFF_055350 [Zingiber officinale]|uniref:Uncharacterized protein n=1 Tax=Zingiber officinale TaxID=94328 RepID=A0A8J5KS85_ZINOF|nr:hypothetical protein ZIOFF_055350 [Zingiber officinale]